MMNRSFQYHAHGFGIGGTFTQPFKVELGSHAATTLAPVGGYASSKSENYRFKNLISYRSAHTYISGIKDQHGTHSTVVDTIVEDLNILDVITADAIIGRLSSKHEGLEEPEIIPLGSSFENLRIAGQPVQVDLDDALVIRHPTYSALYGYYSGLSGEGKELTAPGSSIDRPSFVWSQPSSKLPADLQEGMMLPADTGWVHSGGTLHTSLVRGVHVTPATRPEDPSYGYAIHVPQVGSVYLAELFTSGDTKRLSMLRLELGSPITGSLAVAAVETNGKWFP